MNEIDHTRKSFLRDVERLNKWIEFLILNKCFTIARPLVTELERCTKILEEWK